MHRHSTQAADPFAMLIDPQALLQAIEASPLLRNLNGRIYRPLDRPMIPKPAPADAAAFDAQVDVEDVAPESSYDA